MDTCQLEKFNIGWPRKHTRVVIQVRTACDAAVPVIPRYSLCTTMCKAYRMVSATAGQLGDLHGGSTNTRCLAVSVSCVGTHALRHVCTSQGITARPHVESTSSTTQVFRNTHFHGCVVALAAAPGHSLIHSQRLRMFAPTLTLAF